MTPRFTPHSLRNRISLLVTAVAGLALLLGSLWWGKATRESIHEEVEAAARVAQQWIAVLAREAQTSQDTNLLVTRLEAVGRLRANVLEVLDGEGRLIYRSPESAYKFGRAAPGWFATLVSPAFDPRPMKAGPLDLRLIPDPSRAVLDAWDDLVQLTGWAAALLVLLGLGIRHAIARALAPLASLEDALTHTATGQFDTRLAHHGAAELDRLAECYNHMVGELAQSRAKNARLEEDQAFIRALNARLEEERRALSRELHDEFGQGITAVRAIAGAIAQRSTEHPQLYGNAQAILAMTSQMQDGVRAILQRLRRGQAADCLPLHRALAAYCEHWASCYPDIQLVQALSPLQDPVDEETSLTLLRLLQESLTNVARHAYASQVQVTLAATESALTLTVTDDGLGFDPLRPTHRLGLAGMRERLAERRGRLEIRSRPQEGTQLVIHLPLSAGAPTPVFPAPIIGDLS